MPDPMEQSCPKLRHPIEIHPHTQGERTGVLVRDPLGLTELSLFVPQQLAPLLTLCDGTRDPSTLRTALMLRTGFIAGDNMVRELLGRLDEALMLENERYAAAQTRVRDEFRSASSRPPTMMGSSYPDSPEELAGLLEKHLASARPPRVSNLRGLVCPHIDFPRGFPVYAGVWQAARDAARHAELVVIFGTDHHSMRPHITLTRQSYGTPFGLLPTAQDVVYQIAEAVGPDVFDEELHHRNEHSVEAAAVWLHYLVRNSRCSVVPVLCGSLFNFIDDGKDIGKDELITQTVNALSRAIGKRKTVIVAAADLAHAGPAFGDPLPVDVTESARHGSKDEKLMASICAGDSEGFFRQIKEEGDRRRVCGLAPIYWALRLLGHSKGVVTGYQQCPADQHGTSIVSICGLALS